MTARSGKHKGYRWGVVAFLCVMSKYFQQKGKGRLMITSGDDDVITHLISILNCTTHAQYIDEMAPF